MKRDLSEDEFEALSKEKKKQYIAELLVRESGAEPVDHNETPIAIVMAGLPGAGKTEFLDTQHELMAQKKGFTPFIRIDLDQIVTIYPKYTPESYNKFRSQGNHALARCIDVARNGRYNMMIDGTFAGPSGSSVNNVQKLLQAGYSVSMFYMYDNALTAWRYTQLREIETRRGITHEGFLRACQNVSINLKTALKRFSAHPGFTFRVVLQKKLRDKEYKILTEQSDIDKLLNKGYNIDSLRKKLWSRLLTKLNQFL